MTSKGQGHDPMSLRTVISKTTRDRDSVTTGHGMHGIKCSCGWWRHL